MLAQRYPDAYDGIAAAAPAINWGQFFVASSWTQVMMNILQLYPFPCELDAITDAAIAACDALDGVVDNLVSDADACFFDPFTMVGTKINCTQTGKEILISSAAATVANLTWAGPATPEGQRLWYGPESQSKLTGSVVNAATTSDLGYAMTDCTNGNLPRCAYRLG